MLKYKDFNLNKPKILEGYTLEDPRGADDIFKPHLHHIEYDNILKKEYEEALKRANEVVIDKLKDDMLGKIISFTDPKNNIKILQVKDIILGNSNGTYYPVIIENDKRKIQYDWEKNKRKGVFDVGEFLNFFDENYLNKTISFKGIKVGASNRIGGHLAIIKKVGIIKGLNDYIIFESVDGIRYHYIISIGDKIKIKDPILLQVDPYQEEDWDE